MNKTIKRRLALLLSLVLLAGGVLAVGAVSAPRGGIENVAARCEMVKGGLVGQSICFSPIDFDTALGVSGIRSIVITSLPDASEGRLTLKGSEVSVGQSIPRRELSSLCFRAATPTVRESSFTFKAKSGSDSETVCRIRLAEEMNYAPSVKGLGEGVLSASTQAGLSASGRMTAYDPEEDALTYLVTRYPEHGWIVSDAETGAYRYTPSEGFTGEDSFCYVARDYYGNYSQEIEVTLSVFPRAASYTYADMGEDEYCAAALSVEAKEIMQSEIVGDLRYFHPGETVSVLDFLVMAMKALGIRPLERETFFENNAEIPVAMRGYAAKAQAAGYLIGELGERGLYLDTKEVLSRADAAVMISRMLDTGEYDGIAVFADQSEIPPRAVDALSTAYEMGLIRLGEDGAIHADAPLTRADAAWMLATLLT